MRRIPVLLSPMLGALVLWVVAESAATPQRPAVAQRIDFNRDVRKILSDKCFKCHGPDPKTQKAGLRLDSFEAAVKPARSGAVAITPGRPQDSELIRRILSEDRDEMMPPPDNKNPLSDEQKRILQQWVAEGAAYAPHWAFISPQRPPLARTSRDGQSWPRNAIDNFVLARLEADELAPSPEADRYTLVRRLYLDLIGLPPTPAEADRFVHDPAPDGYERLVDRLLDSPAYGERWARPWLDLARYADTNGYEKDRPRIMWPYRDWVIGALNADMPFDQFTIEQIAGDMVHESEHRGQGPGSWLLTSAADRQLATGFHRNTMINEEGGIDPMEFRFYSLVDRVGTTGTVWLGLTLACAQCHTHKYDPLMHDEFYGLMAFFDQADEPKVTVVAQDIARQRAQTERQIAASLATLADRFPLPPTVEWTTLKPASAASVAGAMLTIQEDGSVLASGAAPDHDTYTITVDTPAQGFTQIRLEAMTDPSLGGTGPGRAPHGNFVLSQFAITAAPLADPQTPRPLTLVRAEADFSQKGYEPAAALDGLPKTGWAILGEGKWNVNRTAVFHLEAPVTHEGGTRLTFTLDHQAVEKHILGKFRLSLGRPIPVDMTKPEPVRRREHLQEKFDQWLADAQRRAVSWTVLRPTRMHTELAYMDLLLDGSVLASGDQTKLDIYELTYPVEASKVTALRLEALPHHSLPEGGPGRIAYEGPLGDFYLSDIRATVDGRPAAFARAAQSFASGNNTAAGVIDDKPETGWSVNGGQGSEHRAVFTFAAPENSPQSLDLRMVFERYYAAALGRFRISVTSDPIETPTADLPADVEAILAMPASQRTDAQHQRLWRHYLSVAPELAGERTKIDALRKNMPQHPTTLVMHQRVPERYRITKLHHRGEFLQPRDAVSPGVPAILHPLPADAPRDRLSLARWLVDERNPLVARVAMNRAWAAFFGQGIVRTAEDFGVQGAAPSHPQLLDYLATQFMRSGWSMKRMHRLIVTSATYRQSSAATPQLLEIDPENRLLARGPRIRIDAELIRDNALRASGLLTSKIGGPSVFPPQPPGITESTYGPLKWVISTGEDRYRRGLYTFTKRTAPYAMFSLFGAPSGEQCEPRRVRSNTPLQALTLLNDAAFVEAARALARSLRDGAPQDRATELFRRVLVRPPTHTELHDILAFYQQQVRRLTDEPSLAAQLCGTDEATAERAAWTAVARVVLNLDETITKE